MAYLHRLNIVHRDLKPENLLLDWNDTVRIVDFGLSNTYKKGDMLRTACGSPCYAAPEMIANKPYYGLDVDIWSCGVILFAMVCGYLPFEDTNTSALYKKILSGSYELPPFVSPELTDLLTHVLCVDPLRRYKVEQILEHRWCMTAGSKFVPQGLVVGYHRMPIDQDIISMMANYGYEEEYSKKCIDANKHNNITAAYFLLLKKKLKEGTASNADISNERFDYEQVKPLNHRQHVVSDARLST